MTKAIFFDLDGTLADTIYSILEALNPVLRKYRLPEKSYDDVSHALGCGVRTLMMRLIPEEKAADGEFVDMIVKEYNAAYSTTYLAAPLYEGIPEVIRELKDRGYVLGVLSNKTDIYVKNMIAELFPAGEISLPRGCTELPAKPDPTVPHLLASELGVAPEESAFVGDSDIDVLTGKNAGMLPVAVSWGYGDREALLGASPEFVINRPEELLEIFK